MIITIDGPTASGKSSVARLLAQQLGFYYLNTGMLYRALAYLLIHQCGYTLKQMDDPGQADIMRCLDPQLLRYCYDDGHVKIFFGAEDITPHLKMSEIDQASSLVSAQPIVREALMAFQRWFATQYDIIAEGRDTGSVVFPDADYKFYLYASLAERAKRWQSDRVCAGEFFTLEQSKHIINERDERDQTRAISPLRVAIGAHLIDNSGLDLHETVQKILGYIQKKEEG